MRAHIRAAFTSSWCIPLYTRVRQPSGLPHLEHSAKLRLELTYIGRGRKRENSADSHSWTVRFAPTTKHRTQTPFSNFPSSQQTLFLQRISYLTVESHIKCRQLQNLTPMKEISSIFLKEYLYNDKWLKNGKSGLLSTDLLLSAPGDY